MQDLVAGRYRLPWEGDVKVTDGTSCGFAAPERGYEPHAAAAFARRRKHA
jgi:formamidase